MLGILATMLFAATGIATYTSYQYFLQATTVFHEIQGLLCALIAVVSLSGASVTCGLMALLAKGEAPTVQHPSHLQEDMAQA